MNTRVMRLLREQPPCPRQTNPTGRVTTYYAPFPSITLPAYSYANLKHFGLVYFVNRSCGIEARPHFVLLVTEICKPRLIVWGEISARACVQMYSTLG